MRLRYLAFAVAGVIPAMSLAVFPNLGVDARYKSVGKFGGASAVAIDPFWVVTAAHVNGSTFVSPELGSFNVVENHVLSGVDLRIVKLDRAMTNYTRILDMDMTNKQVAIVGFGGTGTTSANGWSLTGTDGNRHAAQNMVEGIETISFDNSGVPNWTTWYYELDKQGSGAGMYGANGWITGEGGMAPGDSGGGWFTNYNGNDYLVATNDAIDGAPPGGTSYDYFQRGYAIQLNNPLYSSWIQSFAPNAIVPVPEPGTMAVLGLGALAMLRRRRRK